MPRVGLTPEKVIGEAARLADEVGLDGLTLAAVADRFDVRVPSLYKHVDGLTGVRHGVAVLTVRELAEALGRAAMGRAGVDALTALADAYRSYAQAHPGRYAATLRAPDPGDAELVAASHAVLEVVFAVLEGYGLTGDDAVDATRILRASLHGWVSLEMGGGFGMPRDIDAGFRRLVTGLDAAFEEWGAATPA